MLLLRFALGSSLFCMVAAASAQDAGFSDVPTTHPAAEAILYLKEQGILQGYSDGTFRPQATVNRAEAVKILVSPFIQGKTLPVITSSVYSDVPADAWYIGYVEVARQLLKIIDGPPEKSAFNPSQPVQLAQFLKMLFVANDIDAPSAYVDLDLPLATDVTDPTTWYYPHMRYALSASMIQADAKNQLLPIRTLTRGDVAVLLYHFLMYQEDRRAQALLSETESEILQVFNKLETEEIGLAELASSRALVTARGALTMRPDEPLIKGAVKTAEGFRLLVLAYKAGVAGEMEVVIQMASDAWHLAARAQEFAPDLQTVVLQMQAIAESMAEEARASLTQQ